jgi:hypothetical protein
MLAENSVFNPISAASYDLLQTWTTNSQVTQVNFTNLNANYGADYKIIQFRCSLNRTISGDAGGASLFFNEDTTGANYYFQGLYASGSTGIGSASNTDRADSIYYSGDGNDYSAALIEKINPFQNQTKKVAKVISGGMPSSSEDGIRIVGHYYNSTAIIDSVRFATGSVFGPGSRISMYGLKGVE